MNERKKKLNQPTSDNLEISIRVGAQPTNAVSGGHDGDLRDGWVANYISLEGLLRVNSRAGGVQSLVCQESPSNLTNSKHVPPLNCTFWTPPPGFRFSHFLTPCSHSEEQMTSSHQTVEKGAYKEMHGSNRIQLTPGHF